MVVVRAFGGMGKTALVATWMAEAGLTPPTTTSKSFMVMGKTFDPSKPDEYIKSFAIRRT